MLLRGVLLRLLLGRRMCRRGAINEKRVGLLQAVCRIRRGGNSGGGHMHGSGDRNEGWDSDRKAPGIESRTSRDEGGGELRGV